MLGIRLFNREIGKGGAGLDDVPRVAVNETQQLTGELQAAIGTADQVCQQYSAVLMHAHHLIATQGSAGGDPERARTAASTHVAIGSRAMDSLLAQAQDSGAAL